MLWNMWFVVGVVLIAIVFTIYYAARRKNYKNAEKDPNLKKAQHYDSIGRTEFIQDNANQRETTESSEEKAKHFTRAKEGKDAS
ncbi:MAG: hypothetical protein ACOH5I_02595 [Oligoflexus sp.]